MLTVGWDCVKEEIVSLVSSAILIKSKSWSYVRSQSHGLDGDCYTHFWPLEIFFCSSHLPLAKNFPLLPFLRKCPYLDKASSILLGCMHTNNTLDLLNDFLLEFKAIWGLLLAMWQSLSVLLTS